jgi:hypothetical protein
MFATVLVSRLLHLMDMYSSMDVVFGWYFVNLVMFVISFRTCGLDSSIHLIKIKLGYFVLFVLLLVKFIWCVCLAALSLFA